MTLLGCGHNHMYERVLIGTDEQDPDGLAQFVLGGGGAPSHDPWPADYPGSYIEAGYTSGWRKRPVQGEEEIGWLGYAIVIVDSSSSDPSLRTVTVKARNYRLVGDELEAEGWETIVLHRRGY